MTETKRPLKVFLCHAHADRDAVKALYTRLTNDGVDAWLDKEKLLPGQDWELEIRKAVREADVVVVCLSKQFNQAGFRQKEVRLALDTAMEQPEGEIFIIPARLEECDTLENLRKWHWVDLFEENGYEMLMRALRARANRIGVTLQNKKGWLPNITAPRRGEPSVEKKPERKQQTPKADKPESVKIEPKKNASPHKPNTAIIIALIGLVGTISAVLISSPLLANILERMPQPTMMVSTSTETKTPPPTKVSTPTKSVTSTDTPNPAEISDLKGVTMRLVPAGEFMMGSASGSDDEKPVHQVYLDAFYMDIYEVTNAAYKACVVAGVCDPPQSIGSITRSSYYGNSEFDDYPVIYVDWNQANVYCTWRGASLPTEAQWEKAARGVDGRTYPWGNQFDGSYINFCDKNCAVNIGFSGVADTNSDDGYADTAPVGSYESGKGPYGMYDLAGNVWEWVADWYDSDYYDNSPTANPLGPDSGYDRVLRGGSWSYNANSVRSAYRFNLSDPTYALSSIGIRCAKDATP
jgi:formylglycine-generating enzyme required for sulfatase activity